jgi:hypothetical protein
MIRMEQASNTDSNNSSTKSMYQLYTDLQYKHNNVEWIRHLLPFNIGEF